MLIKIGSLYLTMGTFSFSAETQTLYFAGGGGKLSNADSAELVRLLDDYIAKQATWQQQIDAVNKQSADFAAKMEQLAAYEQQLMQKAAQVDAAHAALNNKVVGVGAMPALGNGGRKRQ